MDALTEGIVRLLKRQGETERRLARIEEALGIAPAPVVEAAPPPEPAPEPAVVAPPPAEEARPALESRIGLAWINRIGVITLILGVGFFFKLAVENQWIGETTRVGLGVLGGLAAIFAADRLWQRGQAVFAQGITATGIAVLYLSVYAAFGVYALLPAYFAFLLMALTTAGAGALALRYGAISIAALGLFGGYATPLLLGAGGEYPWFYLNYVLLLDIAAVAISRRRAWRLLLLLALASTIVLFGSWLDGPVHEKWIATLFTLLFYTLFATVPSRPIFYTAQALGPLALIVIWPGSLVNFAMPQLLIAAGGLIIADRRNWPSGALTAAFFTWTAQVFWYGEQVRPLAWLAAQQATIFALFLGWTALRVFQRSVSAGRAEALLIAVNAAFYFGLSYVQLHEAYGPWMGLFAVALACLHMGLAKTLWDARTAALMLAGVAWILLVLAVPIQFSGFGVTILWALQGAALAWVAQRWSERRAAWGALAMLAIVLIRLAAVDADSIDTPALVRTLANARFLTFAVSAASMFACAYWLRAQRRTSGGVYVTGHAVLLWGLMLEVLGWSMRSARPEDFRSFSSASATILMAAYAVGLVAWGVFSRSALDRLLGLGLIGVVVLKLYLYDVWFLDRVYRVVAFAILGGLLLGMSYLYSRYRVTIESWWRVKEPRT